MRPTLLTALAVVPLVLLLSACAPGEPTPSPSTPAANPAPSATPTPSATLAGKPAAAPLDADVVMAVYGTATADNGAVLDVTMTVHKSTAWNNSSAADRPAQMTAACAGYLDDDVYAAQIWSFAKIDFVAALREGTPAWPSKHRLFITPSGGFVPIATSGFPVDDDEVDSATPRCKRDKFFEGAGTGTIIAGFPGDTDAAGAAGNFTKWANHNYGFVASRVQAQTAASVGITVSECTWNVTELGASLNGDAAWWNSYVDDTHCVNGSLTEDPEF